MAAFRAERRLAAILVADVVGYSRLMGRDDSGTLARLTACRLELLEPVVTEHRGRIINFPGDNALCEFASVVDAVDCAVTIQRGIAERERDVPRPERIYFRIGVNLADILAGERGVYGDGVNVAARLEQLCEPGGVAVSGTAYDHLRGRLDRELEYVGERRLKNIEQPVRVYRVVLGRAAAPSPQPPERPSIAVLPFANMSRDPDQDFFSDGIADDLITELTKVSGLFVASRHTAFALKGVQLDVREAGPRLGVRFVLLGSIRKAGERIRLTTQLIDTDTGEYLWAERFDRVLTDVFAVQDEITRSIVEVLKVKLLPGEEDALGKAPTGDIAAYQLYLRGRQLCRQRTRHAYEVARRLFAQAVELDRRFARAHAGIAECEACLALHHGGQLPIEATLATAGLALELEPSLAAAHVARGLALVAQGRLAAAERAYRRAIALEPEHFEAHYALARVCFQLGRKEEAARLFRCAAALRPSDMFALLILMGIENGLGQAEKSLATARLLLARAERELERQPESGRAAYCAAAALAALGDRAGALRFAARALALEPNDHPVQYNVACTYAQLGEIELALDVLERTMPQAPPHRWAWMAQDADFRPPARSPPLHGPAAPGARRGLHTPALRSSRRRAGLCRSALSSEWHGMPSPRQEKPLAVGSRLSAFNPFHPPHPWLLLARVLHGAGRHAAAGAAFEHLTRPHLHHHARMAVCYAALGRTDDARRAVHPGLAGNPALSSAAWTATLPFRHEADRERLRAELTAACLPP